MDGTYLYETARSLYRQSVSLTPRYSNCIKTISIFFLNSIPQQPHIQLYIFAHVCFSFSRHYFFFSGNRQQTDNNILGSPLEGEVMYPSNM